MLEILIAILIIGIGASLVMPRLTRRAPSSEWSVVEDELNNLLYFARQEAITTQKVHRVAFDKRRRMIEVEVDVGEGKPGERLYEPARSTYVTSEYELPPGVDFVSLRRGKKDLFSERRGIGYCAVMPQGLIEQATLTLVREHNDDQSQRAFEIEPFLGSWRVRGSDE